MDVLEDLDRELELEEKEDEDEDDDEEEDSEVDDTTEDSSDSSFCLASAASLAFARMSFGAFFRYSRMSSVSGPNPMDVKKLMEYLVLRTLSLGNIPVNHSFCSSSVV